MRTGHEGKLHCIILTVLALMQFIDLHHTCFFLFWGSGGWMGGVEGGLLACLIILIAVAYRVELHPDERGVGPHSDTATDHIHTLTLLQITPTR